MFACISKWNYDQKPTEGLKFEQPLSELKEIIKQSGTQIFKDLINDHILNNTHRVTIHLYPSDTFDSDQLKVNIKSLHHNHLIIHFRLNHFTLYDLNM